MAWMALVFYLSSQPSLPMLSGRFGTLQSHAGHFVEYAILALLLQWALRGTLSKENGLGVSRAALWAFVIAVTYGLTDEVHQHFVPGRTMDPFDLLTDSLGAAVALLIADLRTKALLENEPRPTDQP
jgi:VanZ family protein